MRLVFVADDSTRDVQSAAEFIAGFAPDCPPPLLVANAFDPVLHAVASDGVDADGCPAPDEQQVALEFGGDVGALTDAYREEIERIGHVLGCCSAELCSRYGIKGSCNLTSLPHTFTGMYWQGMYTSPLSIAADFADTFWMQAASGLEYAWGALSESELLQLSRVHETRMWLGANANTSVGRGSAMLAYVLACLEQVASGTAVPGAPYAARDRLFAAVFAHDFNLQYLRRLLHANWLVDSYPLGAASLGAVMRFDLQRTASTLWVRGTLVAASLQQQRKASPLTGPGEAPGESVFLNMPYAEFRAKVLAAIEVRCVPEPLRTGVQNMAQDVQAAEQQGWVRLGLHRLAWAVLAVSVLLVVGLSAVSVFRRVMGGGSHIMRAQCLKLLGRNEVSRLHEQHAACSRSGGSPMAYEQLQG